MSAGSLQAFVLENVDSLDDLAELLARGNSYDVVMLEVVAAVVEPDALEVRLRPAIAAAALRTPDVTPSPRGPGWVRFTPVDLDGHARDRALAWLESAIGFAVEGGSPD